MAQSNESYGQEVKIVHSFLAARVCGVIASLAKNTEQYDHYQELLNNNIPIVFYDRICTGLKTERVVVDDYAGSFAAVEYMIQTGCKRIFFYGADPHLEITKNRRNGYLDAMKKYKVPVDDSMIKLCVNRERAIAITPDLLESDNRPDGFFAINDETAAGILYGLQAGGTKSTGRGFYLRIHRRSHRPKYRPETDNGGATWRGSRQERIRHPYRQAGRE